MWGEDSWFYLHLQIALFVSTELVVFCTVCYSEINWNTLASITCWKIVMEHFYVQDIKKMKILHKFVCAAICSSTWLDNPYSFQIQILAKNQCHYEREPAPNSKQFNISHCVTLKLYSWETYHYTTLHTCKYALCWNYHWSFSRLFGRQLCMMTIRKQQLASIVGRF